MLVSFIIPAYNAADTIERCLDSICALSLRREEFEVIVIDDCSTDDTCGVIERYTQRLTSERVDKLSNISLLRQKENHRQGTARNRGVKIAKGEYICFVDADDAVTEGVEEAIRLAKDNQTDMTAFHYAFVNESGKKKNAKEVSFIEGEIFNGIEMQNRHPYWCSAPWGFIYKKEFLYQVNYPFAEDVLFEDSDFVAVHLYYAKRMTYLSKLGYLAYYREGSTTHSTSYKNVADYLLLGTRMLALYERIVESQESKVKSREVEKFAEGILEGACWNIHNSCRRLIKLGGMKEVLAYYERVDAYVNRRKLGNITLIQKYYWNIWNAICLKQKPIAVLILALIIPIYNLRANERAK